MKRLFFPIFSFLLLGGIGIWYEELISFALFLFVLLIGLYIYQLVRRKVTLRIPKNFPLYFFSLILLSIPTFWSFDKGRSVETILLLTSGSLFWILGYNSQKTIEKDILKIIVYLGLSFLFGDIMYPILGSIIGSNWRTLVLPANEYHHHLGDFWAVVLVAISFTLVEKKISGYLFLFPAGLVVLAISLSRSAYLALLVGLTFLWMRLRRVPFKAFQWMPFLVLALTISLFIYGSMDKTLLFSRPYFFQAIYGFMERPFGVGLGNFGQISQEFNNASASLRGYSYVTHNILLEMLVGAGIFSLGFIYWFIKTLKEVFLANAHTGILYSALFLTMTTNFLFDTTYFILAMFWLWFMLLGLLQKENE